MKHKKAHILLVEDNEGDIFLTKEAFEESKIKIELSIVKNGRDALDFIFQQNEFKDAERPNLILLDINIPIINGHEVLAKIKTHPEYKKIPVIVLTTSSSNEDVKMAYSNYANSYVTKPINMDDFIKAILRIEDFWLEICTLSDND